MSDSRTNILTRLGRTQPEITLEESPPFSPGISYDRQQKIEQFTLKMAAVRAEVIKVGEENWAERLLQLCRDKQLSNLLYAADGPLAESINRAWQEADPPKLIHHRAEIEQWKDELFYTVEAAVTSTRAGIAETGTLVIWPDPVEPRSFSLVPPVHFAVLRSDQIYNTFEELISEQEWSRGMPTNPLLISGPSKTADIEQTLAYGVHGPTELIVLLVDNSHS